MEPIVKWQEKMKTGKILVFTGAGMSTESGLPDFRSGTGFWKKFDPSRLATVEAMGQNYEDFHAFYSLRLEQARDAGPNIGHEILAKWEKEGKIAAIITQNVDGFHQMAGSENVIELHGRLGAIRCKDCGSPVAEPDFLNHLACVRCGGRLRPGVVLFGESLPMEAFREAQDYAKSAELFLVLGSSLQVSPANQLPLLASQAGAMLGICNYDPTPLDQIFSLRSNQSISEFLRELDC